MDESLSHTDEAHISSDSGKRRGGWVTFPFIIGALGGLTLAAGGWISNLIVFLIKEFNINNIDAAQIANVVNGSFSFFPIIGAIIADSFFGSFSVISISSCISLLGIVLLVLTATLNSLKPQPCATGSELCQPTSALQCAVLYTGITLAFLGLGATRYTLATLGANQFDKPKHQASFFNWFFFTLYSSTVVALTVIVYIEDNVGFKWGFGLCVIANLIGMAIFFSGNRFYKFDKPQGSPFVGLGRVIVASVRKTRLQLSSERKDYYYGHDGVTNKVAAATLSKSFRFLNRAAQKIEGDMKSDGSIAKPWSLCTTQQVLQKFTGQSPSPLQLGVGHVLTILSMAVSAVMESKRIKRVQEHHIQDQPGTIVPMSIFWLFPQLVLVGIGEAFHFPGQVALYYQEFPVSLRSTSTAMTSLIIGIAYYVSTGVVNLVQMVTGWLPNNLNNGKLDNVYWMLAVLGVINFGYYLLCAKLYKYQNVKGADGSPDPDS